MLIVSDISKKLEDIISEKSLVENAYELFEENNLSCDKIYEDDKHLSGFWKDMSVGSAKSDLMDLSEDDDGTNTVIELENELDAFVARLDSVSKKESKLAQEDII